MHFDSPQNEFASLKDYDYNPAINGNFDESPIFVWDVYLFDELMSGTTFKEGKLFSEDFMSRNILDGEWTYGTPYYEDYLGEINLNNSMKELFSQNYIYYVADMETELLVKDYYDKNNEYDIEVVGDYEGYPINKYVHR